MDPLIEVNGGEGEGALVPVLLANGLLGAGDKVGLLGEGETALVLLVVGLTLRVL